jgi:hypothetical protein
MRRKREDPYAILDDGERRHPLLALLVPLLVLAAFIAVLAYISSQLDEDDVPPPPGVNAPGRA